MPKPDVRKTQYLVRFERIGRTAKGVLLDTFAVDADDLASVIFHYAKPMIVSKMFEVTVDLEQGKGWIEGGRFGTFTIEEVKRDAVTS